MGKAKKRHIQPYGFADHSHAATHWEIKQACQSEAKKQLSYLPLFKVLLLLAHDYFTQNVMHLAKVGLTTFLRTLLCQFTQLGCGCVTKGFHPGTCSQMFADSEVPARRCRVKEKGQVLSLMWKLAPCKQGLRDLVIQLHRKLWGFFNLNKVVFYLRNSPTRWSLFVIASSEKQVRVQFNGQQITLLCFSPSILNILYMSLCSALR